MGFHLKWNITCSSDPDHVFKKVLQMGYLWRITWSAVRLDLIMGCLIWIPSSNRIQDVCPYVVLPFISRVIRHSGENQNIYPYKCIIFYSSDKFSLHRIQCIFKDMEFILSTCFATESSWFTTLTSRRNKNPIIASPSPALRVTSAVNYMIKGQIEVTTDPLSLFSFDPVIRVFRPW